MKPITLTLGVLLQVAGAAVTWYGAHAMFTTAGIMAPNAVVIVGVLMIALASLVVMRSQPRPAYGSWLGVALLSVPFVLILMPGPGPECPPDHPPLTTTYECVPPRPIGLFVLALAGVGVAVWGAWRDIARLLRSERA